LETREGDVMIYILAFGFIAGTVFGVITTVAVVSLLFAAQEIDEALQGKTPAAEQAQSIDVDGIAKAIYERSKEGTLRIHKRAFVGR
jgi:hypothetical protein